MYSLGLTYDTAQAIDVQAGAVFSLSNAMVDVDMKERTIANPQNWQGSAQVTYPKLTQPGRVALSPYIKTDYQISLTIFGQYLENAIVLTTQNNLAFDAEVLTTAQQVSKRSGHGQRPPEETRQTGTTVELAERWLGGFNMIDRIKAIAAQIAAKAAAAAAAANKPPPPPATPLCGVGSMKLGAVLKPKNQLVLAGKPHVLHDQPYKFGSQWYVTLIPQIGLCETNQLLVSHLQHLLVR